MSARSWSPRVAGRRRRAGFRATCQRPWRAAQRSPFSLSLRMVTPAPQRGMGRFSSASTPLMKLGLRLMPAAELLADREISSRQSSSRSTMSPYSARRCPGRDPPRPDVASPGSIGSRLCFSRSCPLRAPLGPRAAARLVRSPWRGADRFRTGCSNWRLHRCRLHRRGTPTDAACIVVGHRSTTPSPESAALKRVATRTAGAGRAGLARARRLRA